MKPQMYDNKRQGEEQVSSPVQEKQTAAPHEERAESTSAPPRRWTGVLLPILAVALPMVGGLIWGGIGDIFDELWIFLTIILGCGLMAFVGAALLRSWWALVVEPVAWAVGWILGALLIPLIQGGWPALQDTITLIWGNNIFVMMAADCVFASPPRDVPGHCGWYHPQALGEAVAAATNRKGRDAEADSGADRAFHPGGMCCSVCHPKRWACADQYDVLSTRMVAGHFFWCLLDGWRTHGHGWRTRVDRCHRRNLTGSRSNGLHPSRMERAPLGSSWPLSGWFCDCAAGDGAKLLLASSHA